MKLPAWVRVFLFLFIGVSGSHSFAATVACPITQVHDISPAEQAFLEHDYDKAAKLYQDQLAQKPNDPELTAGLTRVLLRQQKVTEAADLVQKALAQNPDSVVLLASLGNVQYRAGTPWLALGTAQKALKLDPCYPQTRLLYAQVLRINSMYGSAASEVAMAHKLDPHDPMIRLMWLEGLPPQDRIAELEAYLDSKTGDDPDDLASMHLYLERLKKQSAEPHRACRLVSSTQTTDIPFVSLLQDATHIRAFGLDVKLNDHSARLQIDTGAGGLVVSRSVAERSGLQRFATSQASGVGNGGEKAAYTAYADDIRIGALEFKDCQVEVIDSRNVVDSDGLIGMDVLSHFLVTLDYPMRKLTLGPLPPRPDEAAPAAPTLETANSGEGAGVDASSAKAPATGSATPPHGPRDRYIAPEMKDWERVFRIGHQLLIPTMLNNKVVKLFILDTGAFSTTIAPDVAREVTKVHSADDRITVRGISGKVEKVYTADDITFQFGRVQQQNLSVVAFDTANLSKNVGTEVAGLIGITTLGQMTLTIDYRDGLVKFAYDAKRGYKYPGMN